MNSTPSKLTLSSGVASRRDFLQTLVATGAVGASGSTSANAVPLPKGVAPASSEEGVMSLDALRGDWMRMRELGNNPAINNFWGALQVTDNLLAVTELTFPPFSQGQHSGYLRINGEELKADESRWYAYQILRRARTTDLEVEPRQNCRQSQKPHPAAGETSAGMRSRETHRGSRR